MSTAPYRRAARGPAGPDPRSLAAITEAICANAREVFRIVALTRARVEGHITQRELAALVTDDPVDEARRRPIRRGFRRWLLGP